MFHSLHPGQRPVHASATCPHPWQTNSESRPDILRDYEPRGTKRRPAVRDRERERRHRRDLREAGQGCGGRRLRSGERVRRRLRHERAPIAPIRPARGAQLPVGGRAGAAGVRTGKRSALDRQLRQRADQRLRPGQRQVPGRPTGERRAGPDSRPVGA